MRGQFYDLAWKTQIRVLHKRKRKIRKKKQSVTDCIPINGFRKVPPSSALSKNLENHNSNVSFYYLNFGPLQFYHNVLMEFILNRKLSPILLRN